MSNVLHSRVFRVLLSFLLIGCILVNCSPIKAEATTVVASGLSLSAVLAWLLSAALGIVSVDLTVESLNRIGDNYKEVALSGADSATISAYENLEDNFVNYLSSVQFDRNQWAEDLYTVFNSDTMKNTASWLVDVVKMGGYEVDGEAASNGWSYYGDYYLPTLPISDEFPYLTICWYDDDFICIYLSSEPFYALVQTYFYDPTFTTLADCTYLYGGYSEDQISSWNELSSYEFATKSASAGKMMGYYANKFYTNYDMYYKDKDVLFLEGLDPTSTKTEIIEPSIYVGDIPQSIIEGKENEETLTIPIVDPLTAIATPATAREDINALITDLKAGTITLDDYMEKVRAEAITTTPDVTTPSVDPSDPIDPTDPTYDPVSDIKPYGLDLKDYFPFCIPFDIYDFFSVLIAEPTAPQFHWELQDLSGNTYSIDVDLSPWDSFAAVFRRMQLLLFIVGLAAASRKFIKW